MKLYATIISILLWGFHTGTLAEESTNGPKEITQLYLSGPTNAYFYLSENCPLSKPYYVLNSSRVNVDRFYSTLMAAFYAGKKADVKYEQNGVFCEVTRIFIPQ